MDACDKPILETYVDRTGSFLEEKLLTSMAYRAAEVEHGELRAKELKDVLTEMVANHRRRFLRETKLWKLRAAVSTRVQQPTSCLPV